MKLSNDIQESLDDSQIIQDDDENKSDTGLSELSNEMLYF